MNRIKIINLTIVTFLIHHLFDHLIKITMQITIK